MKAIVNGDEVCSNEFILLCKCGKQAVLNVVHSTDYSSNTVGGTIITCKCGNRLDLFLVGFEFKNSEFSYKD